eukprot:904-Prymnesium_polylepis.1
MHLRTSDPQNAFVSLETHARGLVPLSHGGAPKRKRCYSRCANRSSNERRRRVRHTRAIKHTTLRIGKGECSHQHSATK